MRKSSLIGYTFPEWKQFWFDSPISGSHASNSKVMKNSEDVRYYNGKKFIEPKEKVKVKITIEEI